MSAQEIVLSTLDNRLYTFNPDDCSFAQIGFMPVNSTDISFHPNGNFYALNSTGTLYEIDIATGDNTVLHTFEANSSQLYTALTISAEGIFYACGLNGDLWSYDLVSDEGNYLGDVGFGAEGDLTFFAGELYMAAQNDNIVRVNLDNPAMSSVVINGSVPGRIFGIVSYVESCEDVTVFALTNNAATIYEVNFQETSLDFFCNIPLQVSGGASTFEFLGSNPVFIDEVSSSDFDCTAASGQISVVASGGVGQLTYSLDGENYQDESTFTNLPLDSYTVYVSDENGCVLTQLVEPDGILPVFSAIQIEEPSCGSANGSIEVAIAGGSSPYTFLVDGVVQADFRIFDLAAGTYLLEVQDATGCSSSETVQLTDAGAPEISTVSVTATSCGLDNGQLFITSAGGSPPYAFSLNGGPAQTAGAFTDLSAGDYQLQLSDQAACTLIQDFSIAASSAPEFSSIELTDAQCGEPNGSVQALATGGIPPYSFQISGQTPGTSGTFQNLSSGGYLLTLEDDAGCQTDSSLLLADTPPISLALAGQNAANCLDADGQISLAFEGGTGPFELLLDGRRVGPAEVQTNLTAGIYRYQLIDSFGCSDTLSVALAAGNCPVYLPTAFSPNLDGVNDFFGPLSVSNSSIEIVNFQIYDRWGGLLFEQSNGSLGDPRLRWDGTRNGRPAMTGIYTYFLSIRYPSDEEVVLSGAVQLLR